MYSINRKYLPAVLALMVVACDSATVLDAPSFGAVQEADDTGGFEMVRPYVFKRGGDEVRLKYHGSRLLVLTHKKGHKIAATYYVDNNTSFMTTIARGKARTHLVKNGKVYQLPRNPKGKAGGQRPTGAPIVPYGPVTALSDVPQTDCTDCQWFDYMTDDEFIAYYDGELAILEATAGGVPYVSLESTGCCDGDRQQVYIAAIELGATEALVITQCRNILAWSNTLSRARCLMYIAAYAFAILLYSQAVDDYYECMQGCGPLSSIAKDEPFFLAYFSQCERRRTWKHLT